ncbi:MAG: hypothetical protein EOP84_03835 [Verrucomicrobiaceae bacterium]|nr:MAG: hypothetical protein EOP84_03835 [Verrucomicrobiaceae bacterium]
MLLPNKHIRLESSLLGQGASLLQLLRKPRSVSSLWRAVKRREPERSFDRFLLALDFLYLVKAVDFDGVLLRRRS